MKTSEARAPAHSVVCWRARVFSKRKLPVLIALSALTSLPGWELDLTAPPNPGTGLVDDRQISINTESELSRVRQRLIWFIWGQTELPDRMPVKVSPAESPMAGVDNLAKVQSMLIAMESGQQSVAYHYVPRTPNRRLVIVHQGHVCDTGAAGVGNLIRDLIRGGYSVLAMNMPRCRASDCSADCTAAHNEMFASLHLSQGNPLKFFLEPIAVSLNYLQSHGVDDFRYTDFNMVGLSGGGWTTTVYAAIDPRITLSFPVAGTLPLYLRHDGSVGDLEQTLPDFYVIAGYPELYMMGSFGADRKQVQILNERDDCCFGMGQHKTPATYKEDLKRYEGLVQQKLKGIGAGAFKLEIDSIAPNHMISGYASTNLIVRELNQNRHDKAGKL